MDTRTLIAEVRAHYGEDIFPPRPTPEGMDFVAAAGARVALDHLSARLAETPDDLRECATAALMALSGGPANESDRRTAIQLLREGLGLPERRR